MNALKLQNCVVRIITQNIEMNWLQPYKNNDSESSVGSGFFIDNSGFILTCSHLVLNSKKIFIEIPFEGKQKYETELVYVCPKYDMALLKTVNFKPKNFLKIFPEKDVYRIESGTEVYAIGFPLGQNNLKITKGVISGRQNSLLQTSAPLNPGNSGGPLLYKNMVLGVNISKIMFADNVGYASPVSYYFIIDNKTLKNRLINRPVLGFDFINTNKELYLHKKLINKTGVYITNVFKDSPIGKTGLLKGDILTSITGIDIDNQGLLEKRWFNEKMSIEDIFNTFKIGTKINIEYYRDNKLSKTSFKFIEYNNVISEKYPLFDDSNKIYEVFGGIIVAELCKNNLKKLLMNIKDSFLNKKYGRLLFWILNQNLNEKVCIITHIFSNSIIKNDEILKEGDIITEVNNIKISKIQDYRNAIAKSKDFIELKTHDDKLCVLSTKDVLNNEADFSKTFRYTLSESYQKLSKKGRRYHRRKTQKKKKT